MLQTNHKGNFIQDSFPYQGIQPGTAEPDLFIRIVGHMRSLHGFYCNQVTGGIAVHCVWEGSGTVDVEGHKYTVGTGDIFTFFPDRHIIHYDTPDTPWHYHWFHVSGRQTDRILRICGITPDTPHLPGAATEDMYSRMVSLETAYREHRHTTCFPMQWAWNFFGALEEPAAAAGTRTRDLAEAARTLMEAQYMETATVSELAVRLGVDRTTLFRHFRRRFGVSPKIYMEDMKLKKAQDLLKHSTLRVKEVAPACGFPDVNYFCRLFRSRFSSSPEQWRRLMTG